MGDERPIPVRDRKSSKKRHRKFRVSGAQNRGESIIVDKIQVDSICEVAPRLGTEVEVSPRLNDNC